MTPKSHDTPRNYQVEVANRAFEGNVIAVSDTGTGKTLISVLLLKKMVALARREAEQTGQQHKVAFFVVNKVPLVFQQLEYITSNSDIDAKAIYGAMNVDSYDSAMWESIFKENEVIVLTGQILCNVLQHAYLKIRNCSLIIFDECHHAVGNHCYREIMTEYYDEAHPSERPKIFGMTASPAQDKGSISFSAKQLEQTLHAKIVTARYDDVLAFANRPSERVVIFENPLDEGTPRIQTNLTAAQLAISDVLERLCEQDKKFKPILGSFKYAMDVLGPWCAASIWKYAIEDLKGEFLDAKGYNRESRLQAMATMESIVAGMEMPQLDADLSMFTDKVQKMVEILRENSARDGFCAILFVERRPAAHVLCDFLDECRRFETDLGLGNIRPAVLTGHGSKGDISRHMMQLKEQRRVLEGFRRGRFNLLVATDVAEEGLDIDRCRLVIRFDVKTTLISHIQSRGRARDRNSEYIIMQQRNDPNHLQMISQKESDMRKWCNGLPKEQLIPFHSSSMEYDDDDDDDGDDFGPGQMHELAGVETKYIVETGARVTFASAVSLVHQYCSSLPGDSYTRLAPEFEILPDVISGKWRCMLTMPPNAPFASLLSEPFSKQGRAKRAVAFQACKTLHQLGALSDRMLPHPKRFYTGDEQDEVEKTSASDRNSMDNSTSLTDYPIREPQFWSKTIVIPTPSSLTMTSDPAFREQDIVQLYMTTFSLRPEEHPSLAGVEAGQRTTIRDRSLCLLTSQPLVIPLDPIELFFNGEPRHVDLETISQPLDFTVQQICELHQYQELLFSTILRNPVNVGSLYTGVRHVISPLRSDLDLDNVIRNGLPPDQWIDWAEIRVGITSPKISCLRPLEVAWDRLQDMVLFEKAQAGRLYYATAFRDDLSPNSLIPTLVLGSREDEVSQEGMSFADFYRTKRHCDIQDLAQPLIEVERVPRIENLLQPSKKQPRTARANHARFLVPELCLRVPVAASALRSARWMISALDRVDGLLKTMECLQELSLTTISPHLMLEALTASDAEYAMNYQRLELLGDTFLKFLVSVDLFIRFPLLDEGRLSVKREGRVCNSHLLKRARHWHLDRFLIRIPPVNTHFQVAPHTPMATLSTELSMVPDIRHMDQEHLPTDQEHLPTDQAISSQSCWKISNKTMADLAESTLGAAFLTGGFNLGFAAGEVLLGPLTGIACWDDFAKAYQRQKAQQGDAYHYDDDADFVPADGLGDLRKVERAIGYTFSHPRLLAEAFTHATFPKPETPCYQRLEFLGDAVLDMLVTDYWVGRYPVSGPGTLHLIKSASINNQILGVLAIHLGLHRHILHASPSLGNDIRRAVQTLQDRELDADADAEGDDAFMSGDGHHDRKERLKGEYWDDLEFTKVLGDVLESVVGAIYVDSGWDYSIVQDFFRRAILPTLQKHLSIETLKPHPVTSLTHRVQGAGCQRFALKNIAADPAVVAAAAVAAVVSPDTDTEWDTGMAAAATASQDDESSWRSWRDEVIPPPAPVCAILIHGHTVVTATDSTIRAARKQAAKLVLASMDADPQWLDKYCTCAAGS